MSRAFHPVRNLARTYTGAVFVFAVTASLVSWGSVAISIARHLGAL